MSTELLTVITAILAVALAVWALYQSKQPVTLQGFTTELVDASRSAGEIVEIVQAAVFAAEQLKRTGELPDNNAAFNYAYDQARKLLPDLEPEQLKMFIESAVLTVNGLVEELSSRRADDANLLDQWLSEEPKH